MKTPFYVKVHGLYVREIRFHSRTLPSVDLTSSVDKAKVWHPNWHQYWRELGIPNEVIPIRWDDEEDRSTTG